MVNDECSVHLFDLLSLYFVLKSILRLLRCGTFLGSFDRSAVSLSNLKIILNYVSSQSFLALNKLVSYVPPLLYNLSS